MTRSEDIGKRFGANIQESVGQRNEAVHTGVPINTQMLSGRRMMRDAALIDITKIVPDPEQPRTEFDEAKLTDLADSIRERGLLQPIRVRWDHASGAWMIVHGERRYRAAKSIGLNELPCVIAESSADDVFVDQLVENSQRADLAPIEQARAYRKLIERTGWSHREVAERVSVAKSTVTKSLALLSLPAETQTLVDRGDIATSAAYELTRVGEAEEQVEIGRQIAEADVTRDDAVADIRRHMAGGGKPGDEPSTKHAARTFRTVTGHVQVTVFRSRATDAEFASLLRSALTELDRPE